MRRFSVFPGRVIFDHLGKTGGMAVTAWLRDVLGSGVVSPSVTEDHLSLIRRYGGAYSILSAHIYFQGEGLDPRYKYLTVLRDPIDRVISWLFYADTTVADSEEFAENKKAVRTFLQSDGEVVPDLILPAISDYYVRHFSGISCDPKLASPGDEQLSSALKSLKEYDVVGIFEQMPRFLADVADLIGIAHPGAIPHVNKTNVRPAVQDISEILKRRITRLNQMDIELYQLMLNWKKSCPPSCSADSAATKVEWQKYEAKTDRVVTTPDLALTKAVLREGYDISYGQIMTFDLDFRLTREVRELELGISILDEARRWAFGVNSTLLKTTFSRISDGFYRATYRLIADLPAGRYFAGFAFAERLQSKVLELAWHDSVCEFYLFHPNIRVGIGYADLPARITLRPITAAHDLCAVSKPTGRVILKTSISRLSLNEKVTLEIEVINTSTQEWSGSGLFPINLSYRWFDAAGRLVVKNGERSALPVVPAGQLVQGTMSVLAPSEPGAYNLCITVVQEHVGWFDELGSDFIPATIDVSVG